MVGLYSFMKACETRLIPALTTMLAAAFCVSAFRLSAWDAAGPGAGLFPRAASIIFFITCLIVTIFPGRKPVGDEDDDPGLFEAAPAELRVFVFYSAALALMVLGVYKFGFIATTIVTCFVVVWFAERHALSKALFFSVVFAVLCSIIFGTLLNVELPSSELDDYLSSMVRGLM